MDRLFFRPFTHFAHQVERERDGELDAPCPAGNFHQPAVGRALVADIEGGSDDPLCRFHRRGIVGIDIDRQRQHFLVPAAQHGERAVARGRCPAFGVIEIVGELGAGLLLAIDDARLQLGTVTHVLAQAAEEIGIFGNGFGNDVARTVERGLYIGNLALDVGFRKPCRIGGAVGPDRIGKRAEAPLACYFGAGAALGLIREIKVFEFGFRRCLPIFAERSSVILPWPLIDSTIDERRASSSRR